MEPQRKRIKKIAVEEHFCTKDFAQFQRIADQRGGLPLSEKQVKEVEFDAGRIKEMDEYGINMQILSLSARDLDIFNAVDAVSMAKHVNNELAEAVKRYPTRFSGYCCIPLQNPEAAADELERAVSLGLRGVSVQGDVEGRTLSDPRYEVVFNRMAQLDVPMYLHSRGPSLWAPDLRGTLDVIRLITSGLLDTYPGLTFILGHGGESIPFWLHRLDGRWRESEEYAGRPKIFSQYFKDHFYITTSSQCWTELFQFLIASVGADRIIFATDYPYESTKAHVDFIDTVPISERDREQICYLNAERLFKLSCV